LPREIVLGAVGQIKKNKKETTNMHDPMTVAFENELPPPKGRGFY
jgi:hypothetical protein